MWPIAVEIDSPACVRLVCARKRRLTILAPQAILRLSVDETIRVDKGDEIEVVVIKEGAYQLVFTIPIDQLVSQVLDSHGRNPLASVRRTVPKDGLIFAFAILAPEVNSFLWATFKRFARDEYLRARKSIGEIVQILKVIVKRVIPIVPRKVGQFSSLWLPWRTRSIYTASLSYGDTSPYLCNRKACFRRRCPFLDCYESP